MADESFLDERYFVDEHVYNCPFCNRRHVSYTVRRHYRFDWSDEKSCDVYFVHCDSCRNVSMHLTFKAIECVQKVGPALLFKIPKGVGAGEFLDDAFFYSVPTSFFVLDKRVPKILRELLTEAEGCLKSNFLTGGSACARKIVYELAGLEAKGQLAENYDERIKSLKNAHPEVDPTYFDTLLTIQQLTSSKVHENSYDGWDANHLRLILGALREALHELYVVPALKEDRRKSVLSLKDELLGETVAEPDGGQEDEDQSESAGVNLQPFEPVSKA